MRRRLAAILFAAIMLWPAVTAGATTSSPWVRLNESLAPINTEIDALFTELLPARDAVSDALTQLWFQTPESQLMDERWQTVVTARAEYRRVLNALQDQAKAGVAALDAVTVKPCFTHYWGVVYTGFAALWDFTVSGLTGIGNIGNEYITATHIFYTMAEQEWDAVDCGVEAPNPHPTPTPSPAAGSPTP
jgi:hypothetical protein